MFTHSIGVPSWKSQASKSGDECAPLLLFVRMVPVVGSVRACGILQRADIDPLSLCSRSLCSEAPAFPQRESPRLVGLFLLLYSSITLLLYYSISLLLYYSITLLLCLPLPYVTGCCTGSCAGSSLDRQAIAFAWEQHHAFRGDKNYRGQMHFFMPTSKSQSSCFGAALRISYRRGYDPAATLSRCTGSSGTLRTSREGMFCQSTRPFDADPRTGRNSRCRIDRAASGRADVHRTWHRDRGTCQSDPRCSARPDRLGST